MYKKYEILILRATTILVQEDKVGDRCSMECEHLGTRYYNSQNDGYCKLFSKDVPWLGACGHKRCKECIEKTNKKD